MKTKTNITVYECDHCSKKLFRKHAMVDHEIKCSRNPLNIRACFDCSMCESVVIKYEPAQQSYLTDPDLVKTHSFKCLSKDIFMHPPKLEHSNHGVPSYVEHRGEEITQEKMPLTCDVKKSIAESMEKFFN